MALDRATQQEVRPVSFRSIQTDPPARELFQLRLEISAGRPLADVMDRFFPGALAHNPSAALHVLYDATRADWFRRSPLEAHEWITWAEAERPIVGVPCARREIIYRAAIAQALARDGLFVQADDALASASRRLRDLTSDQQLATIDVHATRLFLADVVQGAPTAGRVESVLGSQAHSHELAILGSLVRCNATLDAALDALESAAVTTRAKVVESALHRDVPVYNNRIASVIDGLIRNRHFIEGESVLRVIGQRRRDLSDDVVLSGVRSRYLKSLVSLAFVEEVDPISARELRQLAAGVVIDHVISSGARVDNDALDEALALLLTDAETRDIVVASPWLDVHGRRVMSYDRLVRTERLWNNNQSLQGYSLVHLVLDHARVHGTMNDYDVAVTTAVECFAQRRLYTDARQVIIDAQPRASSTWDITRTARRSLIDTMMSNAATDEAASLFVSDPLFQDASTCMAVLRGCDVLAEPERERVIGKITELFLDGRFGPTIVEPGLDVTDLMVTLAKFQPELMIGALREAWPIDSGLMSKHVIRVISSLLESMEAADVLERLSDGSYFRAQYGNPVDSVVRAFVGRWAVAQQNAADQSADMTTIGPLVKAVTKLGKLGESYGDRLDDHWQLMMANELLGRQGTDASFGPRQFLSNTFYDGGGIPRSYAHVLPSDRFLPMFEKFREFERQLDRRGVEMSAPARQKYALSAVASRQWHQAATILDQISGDPRLGRGIARSSLVTAVRALQAAVLLNVEDVDERRHLNNYCASRLVECRASAEPQIDWFLRLLVNADDLITVEQRRPDRDGILRDVGARTYRIDRAKGTLAYIDPRVQ